MSSVLLASNLQAEPTDTVTVILNDEQIEQLLQQAEARLQQRAEPAAEKDSNVLDLAPQAPAVTTQIRIPKLQHNAQSSAYIKDHGGVAKTVTAALVPREQQKMADNLREVLTGEQLKSKRVNDQMTAGPQWYDMPKAEITSSLKRDLQLIEMRNVLDPHRHYKKNNRKGKIPTFSQVGTVIEGPTEWYSSRINRKDRSKTFVEEEMKNEQQTGRFKRKYDDIQDKKTSGKKAYYKKLMEKRGKKS